MSWGYRHPWRINIEEENSDAKSRKFLIDKRNDVEFSSDKSIDEHITNSIKYTSSVSNMDYSTSKINLVDLAGPERAKLTGVSNINNSLSALGNVINALAEIVKREKADPSSIVPKTSHQRDEGIFLENRMKNIHNLLHELERRELKIKTLKNITEGEVLPGIVKNITDYGAFIDLGGIDGLLHITDISWKSIKHPSEIVKIGDKINVKVLNSESDRVNLGLKQIKDPWINVEKKYAVGKLVKGTIVSLKDNYVFIDLEGGVEGLIHISEMSWTKHADNASPVFKVGNVIKAQVLEIHRSQKRISLSMKQTQHNTENDYILCILLELLILVLELYLPFINLNSNMIRN